MNTNNNIGNIFTFLVDYVEKTCLSFLYIFVSPGASVPPTVHLKRLKQEQFLKAIAVLSIRHDYAYFVQLVRNSITIKTGKSPERLLDAIYRNASRNAIKGIGATTQEEEDILNSDEAEADKIDVEKVKNILSQIWGYIQDLWRKVFPKNSTYNGSPDPTNDWKGVPPPPTKPGTNPPTKPGTNEAGFGSSDTLLWIVGAGAIIYGINEFTKPQKSKKNKK